MIPPLQDKKILITREENQAKTFSRKIMQYGGIPEEVPLLQVSCKHDEARELLRRNQAPFKWLFFTSVNGVHCFFELLRASGIEQSFLNESKFAAVGRKTAHALENYGYHVHFVPSIYSAEAMRNEFFETYARLEGPVLIIRGNRSRDILPLWFKEQGVRFQTAEVYDTDYRFSEQDNLNAILKRQVLDAVTFTSPSSVDAFMSMKEASLANPSPVVCIGTTTEKRAAEYGLTNLLVPDEFTIDGMLIRMEEYFRQKG